MSLAFVGLAWPAPPSGSASADQPVRPALVGAQAAACNNLLGDGDFEALSSPWDVSSTTPPLVVLNPNNPANPFDDVTRDTVPLRTCDSETCDVMAGVNDPAGPLSGANWAWFGGGYTSTATIPNDGVVQVLSQTVTLSPAMQPARLEFSFWFSRADAGANADDRLEVRLGNTQVFSFTALNPTTAGYQSIGPINMASFATGISAPLIISATTRALDGAAVGAWPQTVVNFNVDDVKLCVPFFVYLPLARR